jgi:hypothetical protein
MMNYQTYKLLNETLGLSALGVKSPHNLGIGAAPSGWSEAGMLPPVGGALSGGNPFGGVGGGGEAPAPGADDMGGDDMNADPDAGDDQGDQGDKDPADMSHEELVAALTDLGHEEDELEGKEDDELRDMLVQAQAEQGDDSGDGETDADLDADHGDDMGDASAGSGDDNLVPNKKPVSPFMKAFMKKEAAEAKANDKEDKKGKDDGKPTFMMKKKCGSGMDDKKMVIGSKNCKGCKDNMKKENTAGDYARPKSYDGSEAAFKKSIREQLAATNVNQKFNDGMRDFKKEDLLIMPNPLETPAMSQPGEAGFAPQGKIGDLGFTAEAVASMMKRIEKLEKK